MSDRSVREHGPTVRALLAAAGLTVPEDDLAKLIELYPALRRRVDRLYEVETGDEVTAAVFRAADGAGMADGAEHELGEEG